MKTWLIIVSVVVVLLAAGIGVGFWMLSDTKAELVSSKAQLIDVEAQLTSMEAKLTEIQEKPGENGGYWWEAESEYPWSGAADEEGDTIRDLELRVEGLEGTVRDLEWAIRDLERTVGDLELRLEILETTLQIHGIY